MGYLDYLDYLNIFKIFSQSPNLNSNSNSNSTSMEIDTNELIENGQWWKNRETFRYFDDGIINFEREISANPNKRTYILPTFIELHSDYSTEPDIKSLTIQRTDSHPVKYNYNLLKNFDLPVKCISTGIIESYYKKLYEIPFSKLNIPLNSSEIQGLLLNENIKFELECSDKYITAILHYNYIVQLNYTLPFKELPCNKVQSEIISVYNQQITNRKIQTVDYQQGKSYLIKGIFFNNKPHTCKITDNDSNKVIIDYNPIMTSAIISTHNHFYIPLDGKHYKPLNGDYSSAVRIRNLKIEYTVQRNRRNRDKLNWGNRSNSSNNNVHEKIYIIRKIN